MPTLIQGIVLDAFRFKENAFICKVFTVEFGTVSLLLNSVGKKNSLISQVHIQPLNQLEFIAYMKDNKGILKVKELNLLNSVLGVVPDMKKYSISQFVAEMVLRTFREMEPDERLGELLETIIKWIGQTEINIQDLHLYFLVQYSDILGFSIRSENFFHDPYFLKQPPIVRDSISTLVELDEYRALGINKITRNGILKYIMQYLERHIEIPKIRSLQILEEVLA